MSQSAVIREQADTLGRDVSVLEECAERLTDLAARHRGAAGIPDWLEAVAADHAARCRTAAGDLRLASTRLGDYADALDRSPVPTSLRPPSLPALPSLPSLPTAKDLAAIKALPALAAPAVLSAAGPVLKAAGPVLKLAGGLRKKEEPPAAAPPPTPVATPPAEPGPETETAAATATAS
ncbi:hypothetical protein J4573_40450 [Actinomadura barringtoniae]|uniref:Uncharacterized protein n=1 Tax=Actinomadura barringtoniae TaxID=1427535 RepID=A0A939PIT1_9ACTN|nr:hypothetical protein [Actinomadura barringtoniae]MBO2453420.1 hypothetical protein [Actinomadura barringtoniae]